MRGCFNFVSFFTRIEMAPNPGETAEDGANLIAAKPADTADSLILVFTK